MVNSLNGNRSRAEAQGHAQGIADEWLSQGFCGEMLRLD
jgi:hypothetical protein